MRYRYGCMTVFIALATAFTVSAPPVASADPPPLPRAEASIRTEDCGLPLSTAWADPPPLALTEAWIWRENCRSPVGRDDVKRGAAQSLRWPRAPLNRVWAGLIAGHKSRLLVI